ncbi:hypothetical protein [Pseudonocardia halophobica]|uniref:hypothetical protein n=1 Tax=Pseudonocardia halophobica TaxID=29401 RepID=UPI0006898715|nr:hypothetical protein [Pseudonocardia halophobica]
MEDAERRSELRIDQEERHADQEGQQAELPAVEEDPAADLTDSEDSWGTGWWDGADRDRTVGGRHRAD